MRTIGAISWQSLVRVVEFTTMNVNSSSFSSWIPPRGSSVCSVRLVQLRSDHEYVTKHTHTHTDVGRASECDARRGVA